MASGNTALIAVVFALASGLVIVFRQQIADALLNPPSVTPPPTTPPPVVQPPPPVVLPPVEPPPPVIPPIQPPPVIPPPPTEPPVIPPPVVEPPIISPPIGDTTKPLISIDQPTEGATVNPAGFKVTGKASDAISGVAAVEVRLTSPPGAPISNGTYMLAQTQNGFANWSIDLVNTKLERTNLSCRATDKTGNQQWATRLIKYGTVTPPTQPPQPGTFIPGTMILIPTSSTIYTNNPTYPVTINSPANDIRQAFIASGYYGVWQNKVDIGQRTAAEMYAIFIDPVKALNGHPHLYTSYPSYFKLAV